MKEEVEPRSEGAPAARGAPMRIVSVVGARPQFVKVAALSYAARGRGDITHRIIHTGQHYDAEMSEVFFSELEIAPPAHNLEVGSSSHGRQTGQMIERLEPVLLEEKPDWVVLFGDTNSTLAGAVAAVKLGIPTAHVEAGLRSFNRRMPEELNRVAADHLSDLLLCPTPAAMANLAREGLAARSVMVGDVMYDAALLFGSLAESRKGPFSDRAPRSFGLATLHRAENTDDPRKLRALLTALDEVSAEFCPLILPLHPRTRARLDGWTPAHIELTAPVSYLDMLLLERRARVVLTDSGGVQKEAYFARVPCVTLREETEWTETLKNGCNQLAGADPARIRQALSRIGAAGPWTDCYGDGRAAHQILDVLQTWRQSKGDPSTHG